MASLAGGTRVGATDWRRITGTNCLDDLTGNGAGYIPDYGIDDGAMRSGRLDIPLESTRAACLQGACLSASSGFDPCFHPAR